VRRVHASDPPHPTPGGDGHPGCSDNSRCASQQARRDSAPHAACCLLPAACYLRHTAASPVRETRAAHVDDGYSNTISHPRAAAGAPISPQIGIPELAGVHRVGAPSRLGRPTAIAYSITAFHGTVAGTGRDHRALQQGLPSISSHRVLTCQKHAWLLACLLACLGR
jgi:hypothetical protein